MTKLARQANAKGRRLAEINIKAGGPVGGMRTVYESYARRYGSSLAIVMVGGYLDVYAERGLIDGTDPNDYM